MSGSKAAPISRREYREVYLRSEHWETTRKAAIKRAGSRCQVCNQGGLLDVHHRTYERLGAERDADLTVLCRKCHNLFHARLPHIGDTHERQQKNMRPTAAKRRKARQKANRQAKRKRAQTLAESLAEMAERNKDKPLGPMS